MNESNAYARMYEIMMNESIENKVYTKMCDILQYEKSIVERLDGMEKMLRDTNGVLAIILQSLIGGNDNGK